MSKFNKLSVVLILIALLLIVFSFFAPDYFISHNCNYSDTGQIGDTIGGLMNPFIAIAGVIVTGLAFYMQYIANKIQVENFEKTQKDQLEQADKDLFIRLIDNLNLKVQNYSLASVSRMPVLSSTIPSVQGEDVKTDIKGYGAIDRIYGTILKKIESGLVNYGFQIMSKYPEKITTDIYFSIVYLQDKNLITQEQRALELKNYFESLSTMDERYQFLIGLFSDYNSRKKYEDIISNYAVLLFKVFDFSDRNSFYQEISMSIIENFGSFINSYVQSIEYIIDHIIDKKDSFYQNYFLSNFSYHEKFILFYYCGSFKVSKSFKEKLLKLNFFDGAFIKSKDMLISDYELMKQEIENVLTKTDSL